MSTAQQSGMFQCGLCKRDYKRLDHLSRHVRSHTQFKPHRCHVCSKSFTRTDLLKRHVAGHESQGGRASKALSRDAGRVAQACKACASNHLRCTENKPCRRCVEKGFECVWDASADADFAFTPPDTECQQEDTLLGLSEPDQGSFASPDTASFAQPMETHTNQSLDLDQSLGSADSFFTGFPALNLLSTQWTPVEGMDLNADGNTDLDDMDLQFLDSYNVSVPFELGGNLTSLPETQPPSRNSTDPGQPASMCAEAFRNSHWHFRPNAKDFAGAEDHNLSLPPTAEYPSPESRLSVESRVTCARLNVATRDSILTLVVKTCNPASLPKAVLSFPSVELLDTLLQFYLTSSVSQAASFLHAPSFDPNEKRPELLAAMAASGAVLTSDPALTKLGYAIAECVRLATAKMWDCDNTLVRDLQLVQAFCIILEIGLWSGHGRQVEIAESFLLPPLTMLRRNGKFKRASYPEAVIGDSQGEPLRQKWLTWVEAESFKRLAFRFMLHDMSASMALLVTPLVSYTEVQLPLPGSADLWLASTPEQWKMSFPSQSNAQGLAVADLVDDPEILNTHRNSLDTLVATRSVLSFAWSLTWEYTRLASLQRVRPRRWNALITTSRLDELLKLLSHLRLSLDNHMSTSPALAMWFELIHLHLHMPFEDIQIFAGMEGTEQARAVYPMVRDWVKSEGARRAIWHAGQIFRAAKSLSKGLIRGPEAILLYHASLAFWVYGLLFERQRAVDGTACRNGNGAGSVGDVWLDDTESISLQRFAEFGSGRPCIRWVVQGSSQTRSLGSIHLANPDMVLEAVVGVVQANFEGMNMPHLTDKLIQLMGELKKSSQRMPRYQL